VIDETEAPIVAAHLSQFFHSEMATRQIIHAILVHSFEDTLHTPGGPTEASRTESWSRRHSSSRSFHWIGFLKRLASLHPPIGIYSLSELETWLSEKGELIPSGWLDAFLSFMQFILDSTK
jgi:hypothetical protein